MKEIIEINSKCKKELIDYQYNMEIQNDKMKLMQDQLEKKEYDLEIIENKFKSHEQMKVQQLYNLKKDSQQVNQ